MLRLLIAALIAAGSVAAVLTGCGDDDSESSSPSASTVTQTVTDDPTPPETTKEPSGGSKPAKEPGGGSGEGDGETPSADMTVTELTGFSSPSGNIGCYIDRKSVRCDIEDRDWAPPPPPADCQVDYGQGISLSAGAEPAFVCAGDTALGAGSPLPYGQSIAAGLLRCESEESGMTCRDIETGRGFKLSMAAYELF